MSEEDIPDIVETLRECAEDSRKVEGDYYADQFATDASVFDDAADAIEKLRAEIIRLNDEAAVIVTQTQRVMLLDANLTTEAINLLRAEIARLRLTDAEREAVERGYCSLMGVEDMSSECSRWDMEAAATLRGLLERLSNPPAADRP